MGFISDDQDEDEVYEDEDIPPSAPAINTDKLNAIVADALADYDLSPIEKAERAITSFYEREERYRSSYRNPTTHERLMDCEARAYDRVLNSQISDRAKEITCDAIWELSGTVYFKFGSFSYECLDEFRTRIKGLLRRACPAT